MSRPDRDIRILPQWAQQYIERLEKDVDSWKSKALAAASVGNLATNVVLCDGIEQRGLPPNSTILFVLGESRIEVHHDRGDIKRNRLTVRSLGTRLFVHPAAANTIYVGEPE